MVIGQRLVTTTSPHPVPTPVKVLTGKRFTFDTHLPSSPMSSGLKLTIAQDLRLDGLCSVGKNDGLLD